MSETKGRYFSPERNEALQACRAKTAELQAALEAGDIARATELAQEVRELDAKANSGGRSRSAKVTTPPEDVLGMELTNGDLYVILKSRKGTVCYKQTPGTERKRQYIYVDASEVWPH